MTISYGSYSEPGETQFSTMRTGFFVACRVIPSSQAYLYLKFDEKLYCFGRPGDNFVVPSIISESERNKPFYRYQRVDLDIIIRPI